jgi:hypothetical protein
MTHGEAAHERGTHNMFTGYRPSPAIVFPSMGSIVSHELGVRNNLPPYVCIPSQPTTYAGSGYLSSAYGPFGLGSDPATPGFKVQDLNLPGDVDVGRFVTRQNMLEAVNKDFGSKEKADGLDAMDTFYQRAYGLISSAKAREAFDGYIKNRMVRPHFANARSIRNALDRARLRQAIRLFDRHDKEVTVEDLMTIEPEEILASRVMYEGPGGERYEDGDQGGRKAGKKGKHEKVREAAE